MSKQHTAGAHALAQRIDALEKTVNALKLIVEKQNDTMTELSLRLDRVTSTEQRQEIGGYVPQFNQWPGNTR